MRDFDRSTLDGAARYYAAQWNMPDVMGNAGNWTGGPKMVMQDLYGFTFKDEFDYLLEGLKNRLGPTSLDEFEALATKTFAPRKEKVFAGLLKDKLAVDIDGGHLPGVIGTTKTDGRYIGITMIEVEAPWHIRYRKANGIAKTEESRKGGLVQRPAMLVWPIYAGEGEERIADSGVADELPPGTPGLPVGATVTKISNEVALLMADACVDNLDEGSAGATIQGRTGSQPADPDTSVSGTNLFTLTCSTTAFGAAADATPGGEATAASITDDSSADATGTLGYVRCSSSNSGGTPLDDHIDGEAGTSGADWNFNTLSIVSGSTVSATSWTVKMPES
jgi:hypothetical protein